MYRLNEETLYRVWSSGGTRPSQDILGWFRQFKLASSSQPSKASYGQVCHPERPVSELTLWLQLVTHLVSTPPIRTSYIQLYSTAGLRLHSPVGARAEKCDTQNLVTKFSFVPSRYKIEPLSEYKPAPPRGKRSILLVLSRYTASTPAGRTIISGIGSQVEGCRVSIPIFERVKSCRPYNFRHCVHARQILRSGWKNGLRNPQCVGSLRVRQR
jgi:hypothetical protein